MVSGDVSPSTEMFETLKLAGENIKYWFGVQEFWPDRKAPDPMAVQKYALEVWHSYKHPLTPFTCSAILGVSMVKAAIEKCQSLDPKKIRNALLDVEVDFPWYGKVRYYSNGHLRTMPSIAQVQPALPDEPWQVNGLTYHTIWPPGFNSTMFIFP
jgi:ABC-type branched-subunit amino acid transport system substrate-binding protein